MEMAPSPPPQPPSPPPKVITKKLRNMVKVLFYTLRKGITKTKLLVDLHLTILKRGKISSKAISNLMLHHHYATFVGRAHNMLFVPRAEYEFCYNNSPVIPSYFPKHKHQNIDHQENFDEINVADKVFEILNNHEKVEGSPLTLPGFRRSPVVRQVRITDSPFPLKEGDQEDINDDDKVDEAAEEFIKKFYKELKKQQMMASLASPSPYQMRA